MQVLVVNYESVQLAFDSTGAVRARTDVHHTHDYIVTTTKT